MKTKALKKRITVLTPKAFTKDGKPNAATAKKLCCIFETHSPVG